MHLSDLKKNEEKKKILNIKILSIWKKITCTKVQVVGKTNLNNFEN